MVDEQTNEPEQQYVELLNTLEMQHLQEWIGREYARDLSKPWPIPPDEWMPPPRNPPPSAYQQYYSTAFNRTGGGGVLPIDSEILRFATQPQNLSDGTQNYSFDIAGSLKTYDQLTPEGQAAVNPVLPEAFLANRAAAAKVPSQ